MDKAPAISVVIPFLFGAFLRDAIESVLSQTFTDWELLLVDDGCVDQGTAIAQSFSREHPDRIRYLAHEGHQNRGVCASRNLGVLNSSAPLIALLDSDDLWVPRKLEEQVALMREHPKVDLLFGCTHYHFGASESGATDFIERPSLPTNRVYNPPVLLRHCSLGNEPLPSMSSVIFRRNAFEELGGFDESFVGHNRLYEDQAFVAKFFAHRSVYVAEQCWDVYRRHGESFTAKTEDRPRGRIARRFYLTWLADYLQGSEIFDPEVKRLLRRACLPYEYPRLYRAALPLRAFRRWFLNRAKRKRRLPLHGILVSHSEQSSGNGVGPEDHGKQI